MDKKQKVKWAGQIIAWLTTQILSGGGRLFVAPTWWLAYIQTKCVLLHHNQNQNLNLLHTPGGMMERLEEHS